MVQDRDEMGRYMQKGATFRSARWDLIRRAWGQLNRLDDESGFTLIELMAALTILSVAFFALAMGASTGLKLVSQARQREAASEIANGHLEHIKNIPYDKVALESSLTHSTDTTDPDYYVSTDGSRYDHTGAGAYEDLEVDTDTG